MSLTELNHPLAKHLLSQLRDKNTTRTCFRQASQRLTSLVLLEATHDLTLSKKTLETPLEKTTGYFLDQNLVFVPILRAGLDFLQPAIDLFPDARLGFIGLARNEETAVAEEYYYKVPKVAEHGVYIIVDPMCATGGSIIHTIKRLKAEGAKTIKVASIIAAPEGITAIQAAFPDVDIVTACLDRELNEKKYICPGLGDFGDRLYS